MRGLKKSRTLVMAIVFFMMLSLLPTSLVYAADTSEITTITTKNADITREVSKTKLLLNEEINIKYTITPKDIPVEEKPLVKKEIMLVIDASSSMKNYNISPGVTRLKKAQEVAIDFLNKLALINQENPGSVKVGLILFSSVGTVKKYNGQVLLDNFTKIKQDINTLDSQVSQGTNIGDGLRRAYYEATKGASDAEKYIVLLSDGEASYFSGYLDSSKKVTGYYTADGSAGSYAIKAFNEWGYNGGDLYKKQKNEYCYVIADMIKAYNDNTANAKKIKPFMIAYGSDADKAVLDETVKRAGGSVNDVYEATEASELTTVFTNIQKEITKDYAINDLTFEEEIPDGFTLAVELDDFVVDGQKVSKTISTIEYKLNEEKTLYTADPVTFEISLVCSAVGSYTLGEEEIKYVSIEGETVEAKFPPLNIDIYSNIAPITVSRTITPTNTIVNSEVVSKYTINPGTFIVDPDLYDGSLPATFTVSGMKLREQLPAGLTVNPDALPAGVTVDDDNNIIADLPSIVYTKNAADQYVASEVIVELPIIPTQTGTYQWEGELEYTDLDNVPKSKSYTNDPITISEYGAPTIEVYSVTRNGDKVDIKVKYTLPNYTAEAKMTRNNLSLVSIPNVATGYVEFNDLSIYETHTAKISSTSTTSVTRTFELVIYEGINVN